MADLLWRPFDSRSIQDPYPMYAALREQDPVHLSQTQEWVITRYDDIKQVLTNPAFQVGNRLLWLQRGIDYFSHKHFDFEAISEVLTHFILFLNPPDHGRIRKFIHQVWQDRQVESTITQNLDELIGAFKKQPSSFDLIESFSKPLPAMTITRLLGLPMADHLHLKRLGSVMIKALDLYITLRDMRQINEAAREFLGYIKQIIGQKRKSPDDKLISRLVQENDEQHVLSEEELVASCILLFIAGEETSIGLTGTGLMNLIRRPELTDYLRNHPAQVQQAVEELIRYDAPVQIAGRIASVDVELGGKVLKAGSTLTLVLGAGNRDPDQFSNPDELDIHRQPAKHLGFGAGAHYCMGDWLARLQTTMAIERILSEFSSLTVLDDELNWSQNLAIRTLKELTVRFS